MPRQSTSAKRTPLHTSLPASPSDGQTVNLLVDPATGSIALMRYSAALTQWVTINSNTYLTAQSATQQTGAFASDIAYTPATITLTPGTWLVRSMLGAATTDVVDAVACGIYNRTTSAYVAGSMGACASSNPVGYTQHTEGEALMTVTVPTQVCPYGARNGGSTFRANSAASAPAGRISALRIGA